MIDDSRAKITRSKVTKYMRMQHRFDGKIVLTIVHAVAEII